MKTMKMNRRSWIAVGTLSAMTLGTVSATPAHAIDADTWKKVAIGAGVVTGYGLIKGKGKVATIGGIATAGSYYMYKKSKDKQDDRFQARPQTFTGQVTNVRSNQSFDIRVGNQFFNVFTNSYLPRQLNVNDVVRVYGVPSGNDIRNASVTITSNR